MSIIVINWFCHCCLCLFAFVFVLFLSLLLLLFLFVGFVFFFIFYFFFVLFCFVFCYCPVFVKFCQFCDVGSLTQVISNGASRSLTPTLSCSSSKMIYIIPWLHELLPFVHKNMPLLALLERVYAMFAQQGHQSALDKFLTNIRF